jgi:hypothetical protein
MKKEVRVYITINDEAPPQTSFTKMNAAMPDEHYIEVYRNNVVPEGKLDDLLAHELGHVIQRIFNTEAVQSDPRIKWPTVTTMFGIPPEFMQDAVKAEVEAWDYARKMIPIDEESAKRTLDTYK